MQKIGQILRDILEKRPKTFKKRHLIRYNPGFKYVSEKQSSSNDAPYCPTIKQKIKPFGEKA